MELDEYYGFINTCLFGRFLYDCKMKGLGEVVIDLRKLNQIEVGPNIMLIEVVYAWGIFILDHGLTDGTCIRSFKCIQNSITFQEWPPGVSKEMKDHRKSIAVFVSGSISKV